MFHSQFSENVLAPFESIFDLKIYSIDKEQESVRALKVLVRFFPTSKIAFLECMLLSGKCPSLIRTLHQYRCDSLYRSVKILGHFEGCEVKEALNK